MANMCFTSWALIGDARELNTIQEKLASLLESHRPERPTLAETLTALGVGIPAGTDLASELLSVKQDRGILRFDTEDSWNPKTEAVGLLLKEHPGLRIRFLAENFEDDLFVTNDREGECFSTRYALDFETSVAEGDPLNYFDSEEQLLDFVRETFGEEMSSADEVESDLEGRLLDRDENAFVSFHEIDYSNALR